MDCVSCSIYGVFDDVFRGYSVSSFNAVVGPTELLFGVAVGVWLAVVFVQATLTGGFDWKNCVGHLITITIAGVFLQFSDMWWDWIYDPIREGMSSLTQMLVSASGEVTDPSIMGMLDTVETEISVIFDVARGIWRDAPGYRLDLFLGALILIIPFFFVWMIFLAFLLEGLFKLLAVTAVGPILIMLAAFRVTRGWAISGVRLMIGGALTVVFAGVAMGFTLEVIRQTIGAAPITGGGEITDEASRFMFGSAYFMILLVGCISILFHLKAAEIASNISGAQLSAGAAAGVVAGGMAVGGAAKLAASRVAAKGRGAAGGLAKSVAAAKGSNLINKQDSVRGQALRRLTR